MEIGTVPNCRCSGLASISGRPSSTGVSRSRLPFQQVCTWKRETLHVDSRGFLSVSTDCRWESRKCRLQVLAGAALADPLQETVKDTFPRGQHWQVHKFGGTCLATAKRIGDAANLIVAEHKESGKQQAVVVSAMGSHITSPVKVTDLLLQMVAKAALRDKTFAADLEKLKEKHMAIAEELLGEGKVLDQFVAHLDDDTANLNSLLLAISIAGTVTDAFSDFVVGHGELWCARLFSSAINQAGVECTFMDTREVLVVTSPDGKLVDIEYQDSDARLDAWAHKEGFPEVHPQPLS